MILNGLYGSSQQINLDWENGRFMHGHTDIFNVTTEDIGPLQNVTMWNDNTGPAPIWVVTNVSYLLLSILYKNAFSFFSFLQQGLLFTRLRNHSR